MITHILKDRTTTTDISGHIVTKEQCPSAYAVMGTIRKEKQYGTDNNSGSEIRELQASQTVQGTTLESCYDWVEQNGTHCYVQWVESEG